MDTAHEDFDRLFGTFEGAVRAYCARRVDASSVDDAVNEAFTVAWRKIHLAPAGDTALPWLYAIAHRVVQHTWRSDGRRARLHDRVGSTTVHAATAPTDDHVVEADDRRRVLEAASSLDEGDQEILRLTLWEELPSTEAGAVLGISPEAARKRASRARRRLAEEFERIGRSADPWARPVDDDREETRS